MTKELDAFDKQFHARITEQMTVAKIGVQFWTAYVAAKYGLRPQDVISADGTIMMSQDATDAPAASPILAETA